MDRLIKLREMTVDDAEELYSVIDNCRADLSNLVWAEAATLESTRTYLRIASAVEKLRAICVDGQIVGCITLRFGVDADEIGYWLGYDRGCGLMKHAVKLMIADHDKTITARVKSKNFASQAILKSANFKIVNETDDWIFFEKASYQ